MTRPINIGVLGAGSFGTTLAHLLSQKGHNVVLWGRRKSLTQQITEHHQNLDYLQGWTLHVMNATDDLSKACAGQDLVLFAIPSQFLRSVLDQAKSYISSSAVLVNTSKGIENRSLKIPSEIFLEVFGPQIKERYVALSGPTFAAELMGGHPSGAVVASFNHTVCQKVQEWLSVHYFRLYAGDDVIGVELGGALKNVMAIGTGIADGLGFGLNTRAGLITRCLHEMTKLGVKMGAKALTFSGLSGLGDLILTCTGDLSRNRFVGLEIGKGKKLKEILKKMKSVAEGVATAASVYELAKKHQVDMPNSTYVYRMLYEDLPPRKALKEILARELKEEMEGLE